MLIIIKLKSYWCFLNFLINKQVSTLTFSSPVFTTKTIYFNIMRIKLSDSFIIELNPSILALLNIAEIVTKLSTSIMQNNTLKSKLIVTGISLTILFIKSIVINIQVVREFKSRIDLFILEFIIVEANTLEMNDKVIWYFCQQTTFSHICLLLASIALIIRNNFSLNQFFK